MFDNFARSTEEVVIVAKIDGPSERANAHCCMRVCTAVVCQSSALPTAPRKPLDLFFELGREAAGVCAIKPPLSGPHARLRYCWCSSGNVGMVGRKRSARMAATPFLGVGQVLYLLPKMWVLALFI